MIATYIRIGALLLAALSFALPAAALAQAFPSKPVKIVVGFVPGGGSDIMARVVSARLAEANGWSVVVENRPGANANIAAEYVAKAPADGYTVLMMSVAHAMSKPVFARSLKYDLERDLQPLIALCTVPNVIVVPAASAFRGLGELLAEARARPGALSYGSSGIGGVEHVAGEMLASMAGIRLLHVPYKGGAAAAQDLVSGVTSFGLNTMPAAAPFIKSGKLRVLAVTTEKRQPILPETSTVAEAGVPGYAFSTWYGMMVPAGTPREAVQVLHREILKSLGAPEVRERFAALGADPLGGTPEEFNAFIRTEVAKYSRVVKDVNLQAE